MDLVEALERAGRAPDDAAARGASGSGAGSLLAAVAADDAAEEARRRREGALGAALTEASGSSGRSVASEKSEKSEKSFARSIGNYQDIDVAAATVSNRAEFEGPFGVNLGVNLAGECAFDDPVAHPTRLNVRFRSVELRIGSLPPLRASLDFVDPRGWIETTYVDDDLRTGRGDKGSIFVAARRVDA